MGEIEAARKAIARAKAILEGEVQPPAPSVSPLEAFEALVVEARTYLTSNSVADDVSMEIKFSKDDFEVNFERS